MSLVEREEEEFERKIWREERKQFKRGDGGRSGTNAAVR